MSDEEKKAIEGIKKDDEYYDILENIKQNKYNMLNVEKLMRDTITGDYTEYEIAQSIVYFVNLIEKQSKEIEEMKKQLDLDNECEIALNSKIMDLEKEIEELKQEKEYLNCIIESDKDNYINKDKIKAKIEEVQDVRKHHLDEIKNIEAYNHTKQLWLKELDTKYIVLQSLLEKE